RHDHQALPTRRTSHLSNRKMPHSSGEALSLKPNQKGGLKLKQFPKNMIAKDAIKAWKLTAMIYVLVLWLLTIGVFILSYIFEWKDRKSTRLNSSHVSI